MAVRIAVQLIHCAQQNLRFGGIGAGDHALERGDGFGTQAAFNHDHGLAIDRLGRTGQRALKAGKLAREGVCAPSGGGQGLAQTCEHGLQTVDAGLVGDVHILHTRLHQLQPHVDGEGHRHEADKARGKEVKDTDILVVGGHEPPNKEVRPLVALIMRERRVCHGRLLFASFCAFHADLPGRVVRGLGAGPHDRGHSKLFGFWCRVPEVADQRDISRLCRDRVGYFGAGHRGLSGRRRHCTTAG